MMRKSIILILILIILVGTLFLLTYNTLTGKAIQIKENLNNYTFTKAICDKNNKCQDYIFECQGKNLLSKTPITGAIVQFKPDWKDPRTHEQKNKLCG